MLQEIARKLLRTGRLPTAEELGGEYPAIRAHVLDRVRNTAVGTAPFYHCFIDGIFPTEFYEALQAHMLSFKGSDKMQPRTQDNATFVNRRYNLMESRDRIVLQFRSIFEDPEVKMALLSKFYVNPSPALPDRIRIHKEFEYVFCEPNRFQNIHVDISPKFMSFVFYIPERPVSALEEEQNATVLYDKNLKPQYAARFRANSVCIFVPHFYSYHGFASTTERDVLVMFYVHDDELARWKRMRTKDEPPYTGTLDLIEGKLRRHPLIEYGTDPARLAAERAACRINAPKGRVMVD